MPSATYDRRRHQVEAYFDRTAADAWARLTSDAPVGRIRATVRAGRTRMRQTLLDWLPADLSGERLLDAGCGTGALAVEAARRGAKVVAIDLSPTLISLAKERTPAGLGAGTIEFMVGDMLDPGLGSFDRVVAMDSLIHYQAADAVRVLSGLAKQTRRSILFTFAPRTPALTLMHALGRLFPRQDRAPAIEPVRAAAMTALIGGEPGLTGFRPNRTEAITQGFYMSQAMELEKGCDH
jgi:magnesium-protoporphyrin O-methyltransferase